MRSFEVPDCTVSYQQFIEWKKDIGILVPGDINQEFMGGNWWMSAIMLSDEDYIAFRLRFGV